MISAMGSGREKFRLLDLDLSHNSLGAGSGEALAAAVRRNETLTRLSLRCARDLVFFFCNWVFGRRFLPTLTP